MNIILKEIEALIENAGEIGEQFQGIIAQRYYAEILKVDAKYTVTITDTKFHATFDANYDVHLFDAPSESREVFTAAILDNAWDAFTFIATTVGTTPELVN